MKIATIKAGPVDFDVKVEDLKADKWGEIDPFNLEIRINEGVEDPHMALTEIHESLHLGFWMCLGKMIDNEPEVEAMTMTLGALFKDNPEYYIGLILRLFRTKKEQREILKAVKENI